MSFVYGGVDTASLAGVTATLSEWPSLGGLSVENASVPGFDGRVYGGATMEATAFTFDVIIHGETVEQVHQRRDNFIGMIDPSRGPRSMQLETDTGWTWHDVLVTAPADWSRMTWQRGLGYRLRADVEFQTQRDPAALEAVPSFVTVPADGVTHIHTQGNTASYPALTATSSSASGTSTMTFGIGDFEIVISGVIPSGNSVVLDWASMSFYRTNGDGARVESLVPRMSTFERPILRPGVAYPLTRSGYTEPTRVYPNYRRI